MDRAELIAKSWENEFKWSHTINTVHGHLEVIARRVVRAIRETETSEASINTAIMTCCGVDEEQGDENPQPSDDQ